MVHLDSDLWQRSEPEFNYSQFDYPESLWIRRPAWEMGVKIAFFVPVICVGLLGNGFVIYLMAAHPFLRTAINTFILNLAVADLISITAFPWIVMCIDFYQSYILGPVICLTEGFLRGKQKKEKTCKLYIYIT